MLLIVAYFLGATLYISIELLQYTAAGAWLAVGPASEWHKRFTNDC